MAAAIFIIVRTARKLRREKPVDATSNMIWSTVGALLMMPLSGVMLAAIVYMVMQQ